LDFIKRGPRWRTFFENSSCLLRAEKYKFVKKFENLANAPEMRAIEEFERKTTGMQKI
jgi:hypothetical protein